MRIATRRLLLLPATATLAACATAGSGASSPATSAPAAAATNVAAADRGAFVVRLGSDTVSVERYTRTGSRIEGDQVFRAPATTMRHYVATLGPNGAITALDFDSRRAAGGAPPTRAELRLGADTSTVRVVSGQRDTTLRFAARGLLPYLNLTYGLMEAIIASQLRPGSDSAAVSFVGVGATEPIKGTIRRVGSDSVTFAVFEPNPYRARVDAQGRILGLQGLATTQKVIVERVSDVDVQGIAAAWARRDSSGQALGTLSPADSVKATVGSANLSVVYSRPSLRGRSLMGFLIPYGQVWRTGANAATMFTTSRDLVINGTTVPAGSYTLWTLANANGGAQLIINRQTGQWGTDYDASRDLARLNATVTTLPTPVERFTFAIEPNAGGSGGTIKYMWGDRQFAVPFTVK